MASRIERHMRSASRNKTHRKRVIEKAMKDIFKDMGERYLEECTKLAPEHLKETVEYKWKQTADYRNTGFKLEYKSQEAVDVFEGVEGQAGFKWTSNTKAHNRTLSSGKRVKVRQHQKNYVGYKPTEISDGKWFAKDMSATIEANPWLDKAWDTIRNAEPKWMQKLLPTKITSVVTDSVT